ncbi:hypothetical protein GCM10010359_03840 [Streptomyces morookaense]|nr:hypothetical protein GCM10010359_03840 [Streptomyces morookaense]
MTVSVSALLTPVAPAWAKAAARAAFTSWVSALPVGRAEAEVTLAAEAGEGAAVAVPAMVAAATTATATVTIRLCVGVVRMGSAPFVLGGPGRPGRAQCTWCRHIGTTGTCGPAEDNAALACA